MINFKASQGWVGIDIRGKEYPVPSLCIGISIPWIKWKHEEYGFGDTFFIWSIEADTKIKFRTEPTSGFRSLSVMLLGFGFAVTYQASY